MRKQIAVIIAILVSFNISFVKAVPVMGKVVETTTMNPLEYANIVLLSLPDSSFISGTVSDKDGIFQLNTPSIGKYLLKISYVGFDVKFVPFEAMETSIDLGNILLLESNILKEVVVTSKAPPFQTGSSGGIVANVSTTLLSTVGTANDVLHRMPGINAENNKITVFGKGSPLIYINNRKVRDNSELERLESSEISTVELINNPGAKYDAEGRAVLLIKTKNRMDGFSTQITDRVRAGKYMGNNANISVAYTANKLNLFASLYHNYNKRVSSEDHFFTLKNTEGLWKYSTLLPDYWFSNNSRQLSTGFDYSLNKKHAIGGQYQLYANDYKNTTPIKTFTYLNDKLSETSNSLAQTKSDSYQHLINLFYNTNLGEKFSARFDFDYLRNNEKGKQRSDETINNIENREVNILNQTDYDLYAGKLTNEFKSRIGLIEFGGEYNNISGNGFVNSGNYANDNIFKNTEQKAAVFLSYSQKLSEVNIIAGLRYEFTSEKFTEGNSKTLLVDRNYSDWYPNFSVSGKIQNIDFSLAFNKRTQRPNFSQLNGNVIYVNRFVFQKGNPYLNKSNIYDVNFQAMHSSFSLNINYAYVKDIVSLFLKEQENMSNSILFTYDNLPKYEVLNTTFNWNTKIGIWQPNYTIGLGKPFFSANYDGQRIQYNKYNYFFRIYNDFTFPLGFVLSFNYRFYSDRQEIFFETKKYQSLDLGLRKSFMNNSLRLNLMCYDIFNLVNERNQMKLDNLYWGADKKNETRYISLSVSYMFNNYKKKYRGSSAAQEDIKRF